MAVLGQAMLEYSRMSAQSALVADFSGELTERSMLERKGNDVLDTLEWRRTMRSNEPFRYHDFDPAVGLASVPVSLLQDLLMELGKANVILIAVLIDV